MKLYTSIPSKLQFYYEMELSHYRGEYSVGNLENACLHLERAHIIGQRYPIVLTYSLEDATFWL